MIRDLAARSFPARERRESVAHENVADLAWSAGATFDYLSGNDVGVNFGIGGEIAYQRLRKRGDANV